MYPRLPIDDPNVLRDPPASSPAALHVAALAPGKRAFSWRVPLRPHVLMRLLRPLPE
jgi:hypothetical protein